ncbi:MAG: hypothetical protein PsegKO_32910 [Pseudohongiellaceae bacterium]
MSNPALAPCRLALPLESKASSPTGHLNGYGSVFGTVDSYNERVAPGAFAESLKNWMQKGRLPPLLWQHDPSRPIGVWSRMSEDAHGLRVEGQLALGTKQGQEAQELLQLGALNGLSIGFRPVSWEIDEDTGLITLTSIDLWEVSLVTFPANPDATIASIRSQLAATTPTATALTTNTAGAMPMPKDDSRLKDLEQEITRIGGDLKQMEDSLQTGLEELRSYADSQSRSAADVVAQERIQNLSTEVAAKQAAIEDGLKRLSRQAEGFEAFMQRPSGSRSPVTDQLLEEATEFRRAQLSVRGQLKSAMQIGPDDVDVEGYRNWVDAFPLYLRSRDERLIDQKAMEVGSDPDGGFLVPTAISSRILSLVRESSPLRELATVETIGTDAIEFPIDDDEVECVWVGELDAVDDTRTPRLGTQKIEVSECAAQPKVTAKFLEDAAIDVVGWLTRKMGEAFARKEAAAFIRGDGVQKPRGIISYPAGEGRGKVKRLASGHNTSITGDGLIRISKDLKEAYAGNARWLMKRSTITDVMLLKDGTGQYLWRPGLADGTPQSLNGYAIQTAADLDAVGGNKLPIAFGDFRAAYTVVDRLGITILRDPYTAQPFIRFYTRRRVGGDVTNFDAYRLLLIKA